MRSAFKSLILVLVILAVGLGFGWFYVRNKSFAQAHPPFETAYFRDNKPHFVVAYRGQSDLFPENTLAAFDAADKLNPDVVFWVDVQPTLDHDFVAFADRELARTTNGQGWVRYTNLADIQKLDAGYKFQNEKREFSFRAKDIRVPRLEDVLKRYPKRRFILNFQEYSPGADQQIAKLITDLKKDDSIIMQSDHDGLLRDLRALRPQWLYGVSMAQIAQILMLSSVSLQSMASLHGDVYITPLKRGQQNLVEDWLIAEIHRRNLKLIVGPVVNPNEVTLLFAKGVDGVITPSPELSTPVAQ